MAMQLRPGRRLAPPPAPRGGVRRGRARPRRSDAEGVDRISDLPEELRLEVLRRLGCAREAARTTVLSSRWRGLWTELRDLNFDDVVRPDSLGTALAMVRPELNRLRIRDYRSGRYAPSRISSLLCAADRLAPVELDVALDQEYSSGPFEIPCFERATSIDLSIGGLNCKLPPAGQFAALEHLSLRYGFLNPSEFLHRCPRLRKLDMYIIHRPVGVKTLTVESKSLEELKCCICNMGRLAVIRIVAPELKKFSLFSSWSREFAVSLSAPKLEEFHLEYRCESSRVRSGEKWHLWELKMATEWWRSRHGPGQLQSVRVHILSLTILNYEKRSTAERSIEQEVVRLPVTNFSVLELCLRTEGHVFGALVLQLLRIRTTIERLKVVLLEDMFPDCSENCDCDGASNWRNEQLSLPDLEVVVFEGVRGEDHELDFLRLLFSSAPMLKRVSAELFYNVSLASGACQKLHSNFAANASVECSVHARSA